MHALYEYNIMRNTGKLRFARATHKDLIYQGHPPMLHLIHWLKYLKLMFALFGWRRCNTLTFKKI